MTLSSDLRVRHTTTYAFDGAPDYGLQQVRLIPTDRAGQTVLDWDVDITGATPQLRYTDHFGNIVQTLRIDAGATALSVTASGTVRTQDRNGIIGAHEGRTPLWLFQRTTPLTTPGARVRELVASVSDDADLARLHALSAGILDAVTYQTGQSAVTSSAEDALAAGAGVCQDHAHIFVASARAMGFPARYVSGYLMMTDRVDQDATHAWAEVHVPDLGWTGFDISNGIAPDTRYVRVATGLDYLDAAPISGLHYGGTGETIDVSVQVQQ